MTILMQPKPKRAQNTQSIPWNFYSQSLDWQHIVWQHSSMFGKFKTIKNNFWWQKWNTCPSVNFKFLDARRSSSGSRSTEANLHRKNSIKIFSATMIKYLWIVNSHSFTNNWSCNSFAPAIYRFVRLTYSRIQAVQ